MESFNLNSPSNSEHFLLTMTNQTSTKMALLIARTVRLSLADQPGLLMQSLGGLSDSRTRPNNQLGLPSSALDKDLSSQARISGSLQPSSDSLVGITDSNARSSDQIMPSGSPLAAIAADNKTASPEYSPGLSSATSSSRLSILSNLLGHSQSALSCDGSDVTKQCSLCQQSGDTLELSRMTSGACVSQLSTAERPLSSQLSDTHSYGFGILSRTRQFGAWLSRATEGEKVDVTKEDLNALAPNSF